MDFLSTRVVFFPILCPTESGISHYASFTIGDEVVLVIAWRRSASDGPSHNIYRLKVSQGIVDLCGDPNGEGLQATMVEALKWRKTVKLSVENADRNLQHDVDALNIAIAMETSD